LLPDLNKMMMMMIPVCELKLLIQSVARLLAPASALLTAHDTSKAECFVHHTKPKPQQHKQSLGELPDTSKRKKTVQHKSNKYGQTHETASSYC